MSAKALHQRNIARVGGIPLSHVLDGKKIVDEDWPRLTHAVQVMSEMQMLVDDMSGLSLAEIVSRSRSVKRRAGRLDLIIVDYLGLMTGGSAENQNLRIASYSAGMKGLAKQLDVPVVLLSQLSRDVEKRPNKRPVMADLRDSGAIEQDADVILFLYRDQVYNPDSPDRGTAEVIIGKQRNGETGPVRLAFDGEYQRFADLAPGYMSAPRQEPEKARRGFQ
jgi:replicative DNA helicase